MEKDIKILVVDDTVTDRAILSKIISQIAETELIGVAPNGKIALAKIELKRPDLVLLDLYMPEMDGLETLSRIKRAFPHVDVIMVSGTDQQMAQITMKALESGALDFISKPRGASAEQSAAEMRGTLSRLISISRARKYSRQTRGLSEGPRPPERYQPALKTPAPIPSAQEKAEAPPLILKKPGRRPGRIDVIALGVSTGGPNALQEVIPLLDASLPAPILAVQHMPAMFTASLAARLDSVSAIRVVEGRDGQPVERGVVYIAPGGRHMVVRKDRPGAPLVGVVDTPPVNSCRPAVDVLFRSVAMVYGGNVLSVILTGMGSDGLAGVAAIRRKGGYSLVQDEKSSVIWGMPGAVVEADQADEIVPLSKMAARIGEIVNRGSV